MTMTPEGKVKKQIRAFLNEHGDNVWWFEPVQSGYGKPALDFIACWYGRFLAIEAKRPRGKLRPRQRATARAMQAAGARVLVIDGESVKDFSDDE